MKITSSNLLQINATVIIGLLFLLSFQSLLSPLYQERVSDFMDISFEYMESSRALDNLYKDLCENGTDYQFLNEEDLVIKCKELELEKLEMEQIFFCS